MTGLSHPITTEIDATIDQVFAYVSDPHNLVHWHQAGTDVRDVSGLPGVGQRFTWTAHFLGRRLDVIHGVTDFEPDAVFAWRTVQGPYDAAHYFQFEQKNNGTKVTANIATQQSAAMHRPMLLAKAAAHQTSHAVKSPNPASSLTTRGLALRPILRTAREGAGQLLDERASSRIPTGWPPASVPI